MKTTTPIEDMQHVGSRLSSIGGFVRCALMAAGHNDLEQSTQIAFEEVLDHALAEIQDLEHWAGEQARLRAIHAQAKEINNVA